MNAAEFIAAWEANETPVRDEFADGRFTFDAAVARRAAAPAHIDRAAMAAWLRELESSGTRGPSLANAHRLAEGALCVVTGQQCGIGLGPLFTLWKAFGAIRHARDIEHATGKPCVPVFWIASDDHDLAEISTIRWMDKDGAPHAETIAPETLASGAPAHEAAIDPAEARRIVDAFRATTRETEFRGPLLEDLEAAFFVRDATFGSAFEVLLRRWLGPLGVVPVRPRDPWVRAAGTPLALHELKHPRASAQILKRQYDRYRADFGLTPIHRAGDEFNFFVECDTPRGIIRARIDWEEGRDDALAARHPSTRETVARWSAAELRALIEREPRRISPNAALRPLVQDAALNSVAYVAGPSEFVYHGQIGPLYTEFGVCRPAVVPRPSVTLVDARTRKVLDRAKVEHAARLSADDLARTLRGGEDGASPAPLGATLDAALAMWETGATADLDADPAIRGAVEKLRVTIQQGVARVEDRLRESRERRAGTNESQARRALDTVYPGGEPQERALGAWAPLLLNYGNETLAKIVEQLDPQDWRGQVVAL